MDSLYQKLVDSAKIGDLGEVLALLGRKADPNLAMRRYWRHYDTPLTFASSGFSDGHAAVISALLEAKADVKFGDSHCRTPLYYASHFGIPANVEILLRYGADPNNSDRTFVAYPLIAASSASARCPRRAEAIQLLIDHKASVNVFNDHTGESALHGAIDAQQPYYAEILLRAKANANDRMYNGTTPLHLCRENGWELLLRHKADPNLVDEDGRTPLHVASFSYGGIRGVRALLRAKADINRPTADGRTPLESAIYWKRVPVVKILLEAGADIEMDEAMLAESPAEIREMLRDAGTPEERRAKACWRSWARAMLHGPTEGDSPPTEELRAFFASYPGLRRFVGTKLLRFSRAE